MVSPAVGKVILVPFPFSDLSKSKMRPAVVLADAGRGDWILCQITSNPYGDPNAFVIKDENFAEGSLRIVSFARPGKLFTASSGLMLSEIGMLREDMAEQIIDALIKLVRHDEGERDPERDSLIR
jgi:mRNA interferase MazF